MSNSSPSALAIRGESALAYRGGAASAIISVMSHETLATLQGTNVRPFRIVICGVLTGMEEMLEHAFKAIISKLRPGPVKVDVLDAPNTKKLYPELEDRSFDLLIFLNVMTFSGAAGKNVPPSELLEDIYERTHKPIVAMSGHPTWNEELRSTCDFVVMDMPFSMKHLESVCEQVLAQNGYLLK